MGRSTPPRMDGVKREVLEEHEGMSTPILEHLRKVLEDHTLPLADMNAGMIEARWLVMLLKEVEDKYRENGTIQ
jgi:hypothetical protein